MLYSFHHKYLEVSHSSGFNRWIYEFTAEVIQTNYWLLLLLALTIWVDYNVPSLNNYVAESWKAEISNFRFYYDEWLEVKIL